MGPRRPGTRVISGKLIPQTGATSFHATERMSVRGSTASRTNASVLTTDLQSVIQALITDAPTSHAQPISNAMMEFVTQTRDIAP